MAAKSDPNNKTVAENRRARREYEIDDVFEAGLVLTGPEVKSLRRGAANIAESYAQAKNGEITLINAYIPEYDKATHFAHETRRPRKLLLHGREIDRLSRGVQREGMTLVPLKLYFNDRGLAKLALGLAKGRKLHDKRAVEKERDWKRQQGRLLRDRG